MRKSRCRAIHDHRRGDSPAKHTLQNACEFPPLPAEINPRIVRIHAHCDLVAAEAPAWAGRNLREFSCLAFAISLCGCPRSCRSLDVACILESLHRTVQSRSRASRRARSGQRRAGQEECWRSPASRPMGSTGSPCRRPSQMLVSGTRGDRGGEEDGRKAAIRRCRGERGCAAQAECGRGCTCGAIAARAGGSAAAVAASARRQGGRCRRCRSRPRYGGSSARATATRPFQTAQARRSQSAPEQHGGAVCGHPGRQRHGCRLRPSGDPCRRPLRQDE